MKKVRDGASLIWNVLDGKKTYIGAAVIFLAGGLRALGKIDEETYQTLVTLGGAIAVFGLREAIKKLLEK